MTQQTAPLEPTDAPAPLAPTPPRLSLLERLRESGVDPLRPRSQAETIRTLQKAFGPRRQHPKQPVAGVLRCQKRSRNQALDDYRNARAMAKRQTARVYRTNTAPNRAGRTAFQERVEAVIHTYRTRSQYRAATAMHWFAARMGVCYHTVHRWRHTDPAKRKNPSEKAILLLAEVEREVAQLIFAVPTLL